MILLFVEHQSYFQRHAHVSLLSSQNRACDLRRDENSHVVFPPLKILYWQRKPICLLCAAVHLLQWRSESPLATKEHTHSRMCVCIWVLSQMWFSLSCLYTWRLNQGGATVHSAPQIPSSSVIFQTHLQVGIFKLMLFIVYLIRIPISHNAIVGV